LKNCSRSTRQRPCRCSIRPIAICFRPRTRARWRFMTNLRQNSTKSWLPSRIAPATATSTAWSMAKISRTGLALHSSGGSPASTMPLWAARETALPILLTATSFKTTWARPANVLMQSTKASRRKWLLAGGAALIVVAAGAAAALAWHKSSPPVPAEPVVVLGDGVTTPGGMAWIPPGSFQMGSDSKLAQANEKPAHAVSVKGFWMDVTHVTNDEFAEFVRQTGYVTTAEQKPDWETIRVQLPPGIPKPPDDVL